MTGPPSARRLDLAPDSDRLLSLLAICANRTVSTDVIAHLEAASAAWERADKALANLRLVFAGLPVLDDPADVARLSLAAYCLDQGMKPRVLMKELGFDTTALDVIKFDPNQPRVPAGSGPESGRWTAGEGRAFVAPMAPSFLATASPEIVASLAEFAARFSVPTAVLGALIIPTPNSGGVTTGVLPDAPEIAFRKDDPAGTLRLTTRLDDGSDAEILARNQRGLYVDADTGKPLGRNLGDQIYLDLDAVHEAIADASPQAARVEPDARPRAATDEPKLCPAPTPDTGHGASDRAKDYEADVHARVNPLAPIPQGFGVKALDPATGEYVFFDDCFRYAGDLVDGDMKPGDLVEAKGERYDYLYSQKWYSMTTQDLAQAEKQLRAADARGVGLKWYFAEEGAAKQARSEFEKAGLERIVVSVMKPKR